MNLATGCGPLTRWLQALSAWHDQLEGTFARPWSAGGGRSSQRPLYGCATDVPAAEKSHNVGADHQPGLNPRSAGAITGRSINSISRARRRRPAPLEPLLAQEGQLTTHVRRVLTPRDRYAGLHAIDDVLDRLDQALAVLNLATTVLNGPVAGRLVTAVEGARRYLLQTRC